MASDGFVPEGIRSPRSLVKDRFRLEPLGPQQDVADHAAWTSSIEHIRATPDYPDGRWPPRDVSRGISRTSAGMPATSPRDEDCVPDRR